MFELHQALDLLCDRRQHRQARSRGTEAGRLEPNAEKIPRWDDVDDTGATPSAGGTAAQEPVGEGAGGRAGPRAGGEDAGEKAHTMRTRKLIA